MLQLYSNIKNRRLELGLTQNDLAQKMGYSDRSMISRIENGDVDLPQSKILDFARVLETSPSDLMGDIFQNVNQGIVNNVENNNGTISNNLGADSGNNTELNNNTYTTNNNYYSSPCKKHAVNHEIEATINSKEYFFRVLDHLKDMTDEQLLDMIKYAEFISNK